MNGRPEYQLGFAVNGHPAPPDAAEVLNSSFGAAATSDNENDGDDLTTAFFGVSQAFAASNENVDGSPTVANIGRNTISVAALNDLGTVTSSDDVVTGFSSRGPTPGGRKKPDLIAPGGAVVAADAAWNTPPSNPDYTPRSGTSFASPHVAGAMTLLEGAGITDPMAQRAILINSARDWNGSNGTPPYDLHGWVSGTQTGWRPEVGWGILDLTTALAQRSYYRLGNVSEGEATFFRATVPAGSKATMAFQLRGFFSGYPGPPYPVGTTKYTVSNLDLHQYDATDAEVIPPAAFDPPDTTIDPGPNAIDPNDTIEQVRSPAAPGTQQVTYKVQAASTIDGAAAEPFALAAAAPLTPLVSPTVRLSSLNASQSNVRCNQPVQIMTTATNDSPDLAATSAAVTIQLPPGVALISGSSTQTVAGGTLATAATSETKIWTVVATTEGGKTITVEGAGDAYGTTFRDSSQLTISADCAAPTTSIESGPADPTNDPTPSFSFSGAGSPASFECSIDSSGFAPCSSPYIAAALADGQHSFRVRALDAVGNADPLPPTRSFMVDTQPPETAIELGPAGTIRSNRVSFVLAGANRFECRLDDVGFDPCSSPTILSGLAPGHHDFAARAIDDAGNVDPSPATRTFAVDRGVVGAWVRVRRSVPFTGALALNVRASLGESGTIRVRGAVELGRMRVRAKAVGAKLGPGRVRLRLRAGHATNRAIATALQHGKVRLVVSASFTDEVGNTRTIKRVVKLR